MATDKEKAGADGGRIITVGRFYDLTEAELAVSILSEEGIAANLIGANTFNTHYFLGFAGGGIRLEVREQDALRATQILKDNLGGQNEPVADPQQTNEGTEKCPNCGGSEIVYEKYDRKSFFLTLVLIGFPVPVKSSKAECLDCGHTWSAKTEN
jgi:DNA-directed RNA polymerase subunit M/transcription elongation factor TFIIS